MYCSQCCAFGYHILRYVWELRPFLGGITPGIEDLVKEGKFMQPGSGFRKPLISVFDTVQSGSENGVRTKSFYSLEKRTGKKCYERKKISCN